MTRLRKFILFISCVFLLMHGGGFKAEADSVKYIDADGTEKTADAKAINTSDGDKELSAGWHYVRGEVKIGTDGGKALKLSGNGVVNLILCDGAKLTTTKIDVDNNSSTASLVIYAQSTGNNAGTLEITAGNAGAQIDLTGSVTINGGNININSGVSPYIHSSSGSVTVNGGTVNVTSTGNSAFINGYNGSVTINGGTVKVTSTNESAYIQSYNGGNVTISGGQVTVNGKDTNNNKSGIICGGSGSITLGYTNGTDFIQAPGYYNRSIGSNGYNWTAITPTIAAGKTFAVLTGGDFTTIEKVIDSSTSLTPSELDDKKLVPTLSVTFNANSGTGTMNPQMFASGVAQALTANAFTRNGYTFKEWNTQADGSGTSYADGAQVTLTENLTLYAQWTPVSYTITYNLDGGTVTKANPTSYTAETESFTLNNPTKENYTFTGWTGTGLTEVTKTVTIAKGSTGDRTYTANYSGSSSGTLTALEVSITGEQKPSTKEYMAITSNYTANVTGTYSDGSNKTLTANDYSLEWTLDKSISGVSINNGTLSVSDSTLQGEYELTITAAATQGSITGSGAMNITLNVYKREETTDASYLDSMTTAEKNAIETLALSDNPDNKITDLQQIDFKDFTNLNTLDLSGLKNLDEADLSILPKNVKNVSLKNTNITSLNLNGSKVERVNANGCKNLTDIDAEENDSLIELNVSESNINVINVKNCINLQVLNCSSCDIEAGKLNLEGCSSLASLDISKNHFGWFDYNESALDSFECYSQDITGWEGRKTFSFTKFFNSGDVTAAGVKIIASAYVNNVGGITGYTESGDKILTEYDSGTGVVTFESTPAVIKYLYDTGLNDSSMDVTIHALTGGYDDDDDNYLGDSGCGGCNAGLSFSSLILAAFMFMFSKK